MTRRKELDPKRFGIGIDKMITLLKRHPDGCTEAGASDWGIFQRDLWNAELLGLVKCDGKVLRPTQRCMEATSPWHLSKVGFEAVDALTDGRGVIKGATIRWPRDVAVPTLLRAQELLGLLTSDGADGWMLTDAGIASKDDAVAAMPTLKCERIWNAVERMLSTAPTARC